MTVRIAAFYKFHRLAQYQDLQAPLLAALKELGCKGSLLLAEEGVNGTIAAPADQLAAVLAAIRQATGIAELEGKFSSAEAMPFKRMKVRLKKEIVTIGDVYAEPSAVVGTYVEAADWNTLIADPDTILIDTRNEYEVKIGTFKGAIDPHTESFSAFPDFVRTHLPDRKTAKIAMFCTGGIRCEKATSFMKHEGYEQVFHLKGGILKYLETVPPEHSLWRGGCFVFDERVALGHGLHPTGHVMCHGCQMPVSPDEQQMALYEEGVRCPACATTLTIEQMASNRERQRQFVLAQKRGLRHLGPREE